jgi:hypothetical protein
VGRKLNGENYEEGIVSHSYSIGVGWLPAAAGNQPERFRRAVGQRAGKFRGINESGSVRQRLQHESDEPKLIGATTAGAAKPAEPDAARPEVNLLRFLTAALRAISAQKRKEGVLLGRTRTTG